jgi:hypothetical protein
VTSDNIDIISGKLFKTVKLYLDNMFSNIEYNDAEIFSMKRSASDGLYLSDYAFVVPFKV